MDAPVSPAGPAVWFASDPRPEPFHFSASGAEYFRIWIVNLSLTIVTLGVYSAWAKVRRLRYFYGSTQLAGSAFEYHGQPLQILRGRLIAVALLIPYFIVAALFPPWDFLFLIAFFIAFPFLVVKSRLFGMRMTSWRNIRFDFTGTYGAAARVYIGLALLTLITLGLAAPYWTYARQKFLIGQTRVGTTQVDFRASAADYYVAIILGGLVLVGGVVAAIAITLPLPDSQMIASLPGFDLRSVVMIPVMGLAYLFAFAFINARITNAAFDNTWIGPHKLSCKLSAVRLFLLYLTSALAALVSLGLLIPWVQVRLARYHLSCMQLYVNGNLDEFVGAQHSQVSATGQEVGDLLDVDMGL
jgi:uncharacterized membrane protein YjgN (DUF898 family)